MTQTHVLLTLVMRLQDASIQLLIVTTMTIAQPMNVTLRQDA